MVYDLARMAKRTGTKRTEIVLRPIEMTRTLEIELYAIVKIPVDAMAKTCRDTVLPAYERAISQLVTDSPDGDIRQALVAADIEVASVASSVVISARLRQWMATVVNWHTNKWVAAIKAGVNVDVYPFIDLQANAPYIEAMVQRNAALITSVSEQVKSDVAEVVWREFQNRTPRRKVGKMLQERMDVARSRANLIAIDQANKTAAELTKLRQLEAGIRRFKWSATMDTRTRPEHAALNGKVFAWDKPPSIGLPGTPIRCRCTGQAVLDLDY